MLIHNCLELNVLNSNESGLITFLIFESFSFPLLSAWRSGHGGAGGVLGLEQASGPCWVRVEPSTHWANVSSLTVHAILPTSPWPPLSQRRKQVPQSGRQNNVRRDVQAVNPGNWVCYGPWQVVWRLQMELSLLVSWIQNRAIIQIIRVGPVD